MIENQMNPVFSIAKYIFQNKNIENKDDSIGNFFQNGISFPKFACIVLQIDKIPGVEQKIKNPKMAIENNNHTLNYLSQNPEFNKDKKITKPYFETEKNQTRILTEILTKIYYKISQKDIIEKANLILQPLSKNKLISTKQIISGYFLLSILNILTDDETEKPLFFDNEANLQKSLIENFQKANIPYFLDQNIFRNKDEDVFLIQVQIIFNIYSEKIVQILTDRFLLNLINYIGTKIQFPIKFDHFSQIHENNSFQKYVKKYLLSINDKELSAEINSIEMKTVSSVIDFLKKKDKKFEILYFNFQNPIMQVNSTISFFRALFNRFFIKKTKRKIYERCSKLLFIRFEFNDFDTFHELGNINCYLELLYFLKKGQFSKHSSSHPIITHDELEKKFKKRDIFMAIDQNVLKNFDTMDIVQDLSFYQLQLIFDKLDSSYARISEVFANLYKKFLEIKVPNYVNLAESIKDRQRFIEFQKKTKENFQIKKEKAILDKEKLPFEQNHDEFDELLNNEINQIQQKLKTATKTFDNKNESPESFWNPSSNTYKLDNGILCYDIHARPQVFKFDNGICDKEVKLYKIFYFDEKNFNWKFDSKIFDEIKKDFYHGKDQRVPIVLYMNSNENDLISMNYHFINGKFPDLSSKDKTKIFIYGIVGDLFFKYLTFDFNDPTDEIIKPLFLLLHVPKEKQNLPDIHRIVFQIYSFLSLKSDVNITLFSFLNHFDDQKQFIINHKFITECQSTNDKLKYLQHSLSQLKEENQKDDENEYFNNYNENPKFIYLKDDFKHSKFMDDSISTHVYGDVKTIDIAVNEYDTYFEFQQTLGDLFYSSPISLLSETKQRFSNIQTSTISGLYLEMKLNSDSYNLKQIIQNRIQMIKSVYQQNETNINILYLLINEILLYTPEFDIVFRNRCSSFILDIFNELFQNIEQILANQLREISEEHINQLENQINERHFWTEEQIQIIIRSHFIFLDEQFFKLITKIKNKLFFNIISDNFMYIPITQRSLDLELFNQKFKKFRSYIEIKKKLNLKDPFKDSQKNANYVVKEKVIDKQVKISIEVNKLEDDIEQDF